MATALDTFIGTLTTLQASGPIQELIKKLPDGVHEETLLLDRLNKNSRMPMEEGGSQVSWNIKSSTRRAVPYYAGSKLDLNPQENLKTMSLAKAYYSIDVSYYKTDLLQNRGSKNRMIDYVAHQINEARENMATTLELDILGNGTTSADGTTIGGTVPCIVGLGLLLEDTPTTSGSTYGAQVRTSTTTWLNGQSLSVSSLASLTLANIKDVIMRCTHNGKTPDTIMMNDTAYKKFFDLAKTDNAYRGLNKGVFDMGYPENLEFGAATVIPTKSMTISSSGGLLTADQAKIWFLNTKDGLGWKVDPSDDMVLEPVIRLADEHSLVQHLTCSVQLIGLNPRLNGVIYYT